MKFEYIFLVLTITLVAAQYYNDEEDDNNLTTEEILIRVGWWEDFWNQVKGAFTVCPACGNDFKPNQWSQPNCKCYFKTRITVGKRDCCVV